MAKYKKYDYNQTVLLPLSLSNQLQESTLEFYINNIVNDKIDMTVFDDKYSNDESGSPAYDPRILLKVILLAYSRGLTSSRRIEQACKGMIIFLAKNSAPMRTITVIPICKNVKMKKSTLIFRIPVFANAMSAMKTRIVLKMVLPNGQKGKPVSLNVIFSPGKHLNMRRRLVNTNVLR